MAVKASAHITLNSVVDIQATYRYYQLKSSTATKPSVPAVFPPPSPWADSEPTYTSGSTNSLYFVDCTVFSDGGFKYSAVSMSTSYEAAKEAYNKAQNAQDTADDAKSSAETAYNKVNSRGEQLIVNGSGLMGDNTNFSKWIYDGAVSHNSAGSFTMSEGTRSNVDIDEYFPIAANNEYTFSFDVKSKNGLSTLHSMMTFYDIDKLSITASNSLYLAGSTTTLAQDLKAGDTVIYLTDASGWSTTYYYGFYLSVWNYTNSFGYTYPAETYTRNRVTLPKTSDNKLDGNYINKTTNTLTLTTAYRGATIPAGTAVSQGADGATYKYTPLSGQIIPGEWNSYSGKISGIDYSGENKVGMMPPGTAYAKVGFLWNYNSAADQLWVTNVSVTDTTALTTASDAWTEVNNLEIGARNLFLNSSFSENLDKWDLSYRAAETGAISCGEFHGKKCARVTGSLNSTVWFGQSVLGRLEPGKTYIMSCWVYSDNIAQGTTNFRALFVHTGRYRLDGTTKYFGSGDKAIPINAGVWQKFVWTFVAHTDEPVAEYSDVQMHLRDCTGDMYFYNLQLECGTRATDWTPAVEDTNESISDAQNAANSAQELADTNADRIATLEAANGEVVIKITDVDGLSDQLKTVKSDLGALTTEVGNKADSTYVDDAIQNGLENGTVRNLETSNGDVEYRFGADGMHITDTANNFESVVDEKGMKVFKGNDVKLSATEAGVEAKDLKATTYLIVADKCRFEEHNGRMGCFWIG